MVYDQLTPGLNHTILVVSSLIQACFPHYVNQENVWRVS